MSIDKSGKWWKGQDFDDIKAYLIEYSSEGYPATTILPCVCSCGGRTFSLEGDREEECAKRICESCKSEAFIADSGEFWEDASPKPAKCSCRGKAFELAVGFAFHEDGDVRWIYLGLRCVKCGILGCFVEIKINDSPTDHLLRQI